MLPGWFFLHFHGDCLKKAGKIVYPGRKWGFAAELNLQRLACAGKCCGTSMGINYVNRDPLFDEVVRYPLAFSGMGYVCQFPCPNAFLTAPVPLPSQRNCCRNAASGNLCFISVLNRWVLGVACKLGMICDHPCVHVLALTINGAK